MTEFEPRTSGIGIKMALPTEPQPLPKKLTMLPIRSEARKESKMLFTFNDDL